MVESAPVLVSISCLTYNHGKFIRQALDGFLNQQTEFSFEILIHDDASTDDTVQIITEYQQKYPNLIYPIFQETNLWSQGKRALSATYNFPRAKGKYIAMCEGDDYWTNPQKLQQQVEFLEQHSDYVACVHGAHFYDEKKRGFIPSKFETISHDFDLQMGKILNESGGVYPSCSIVMRNAPPFYPKELLNFPSGDLTLIIFLRLKGKVRFFKDLWSVYRIHSNGVYQGQTKDLNNIIRNRFQIQDYYRELSSKLPTDIKMLVYIFKLKNILSIGYLKLKSIVKFA